MFVILKDWRKESEGRLTAEEKHVLWDKGTEARNKGYTNFLPKSGYFACKVCETPLYSFSSKFHSGCGWPAFDKFYKGSVATTVGEFLCEIKLIVFRQLSGHEKG